MKTALVLWALFVGAFGAPSGQGSCRNPLPDRLKEFRETIEHTMSELDEATAELINLDHEMEEKSVEGREHALEIDVLEYKIDHLHGPGHCGEKEFWCGGDSLKCIGQLEVCDGDHDCPNDHDEAHCEVLTPTGSVWKGHVVFDHCTQRHPDFISFTVESMRQEDWFKERPIFDVSIDIDKDMPGLGHGHWSLVSKAYYNFGKHKLIILPPEADRLALVCEFDGVHDDHCDGHIVHEGTLDRCAEFYFERQ